MTEIPSRLMHWLADGGAADDRPTALTRWFAAVGALAIGAFTLVMAWQVSRTLEQRLLERDAALSRDFVQSIANIQQIGGFFRDAARHPEPAPQVVEFFAHVAAMPDVLRANVYALDRRVLWSSQPELIGKVFPANDELDRALAGEVVVHPEDDEHGETKAEHQGLSPRQSRYVEDYLPITDASGGSRVGVIELYRRPDALFSAIDALRMRVFLIAIVGGLFLFAVLVWFVRRTERALRAQQLRLVEAETLAAVGELSAAVAHSIRNPLVSIRTSAELQRELHGDEQGVHEDTMRNVDRIEHLVRTLLTYASEPSERAAAASLVDVLRAAAERFAGDLAAHGKHLDIDLGASLGCVKADPVALAQVFNSLLANAAEATRDGDTVHLIARRVGSWADVRLVDSGHGIPAAQRVDAFKPFFTTKPRGLGLGLPLAQRIVRRLGGAMELRDGEGGRGTEVKVRLPVQEVNG